MGDRCLSNSEMASNPPADAPIATIGIGFVFGWVSAEEVVFLPIDIILQTKLIQPLSVYSMKEYKSTGINKDKNI